MAAKSDIIDKKALEESLKEITSSIEKSFSSSLANVTKGITAALFLIARPSVVTVNTNNAEKNVKNLEREIKILDSAIAKKRSIGLDTKEEEKSLKILKEKQLVASMTAKEINKEINLLKEKQKVLNSFELVKSFHIKTASLDDANRRFDELEQRKIAINVNINDKIGNADKLDKQLNDIKEEEIGISTSMLFERAELDVLKGELTALGMDTTNIPVGLDDKKVTSELDAVEKQLKNAEKEKTMKLTMRGFEKVISQVEQIDKGLRAFGGTANAVVDMMTQLELNDLGDSPEEVYKKDIEDIEEKHGIVLDSKKEELDELFSMEEEQQEVMKELREAKTAEEMEAKQEELDSLLKKEQEQKDILDALRATDDLSKIKSLEEDLALYGSNVAEKLKLNNEIAESEKKLLVEKGASESLYNIDKEAKEEKYARDKARLEKKQAERAKAMKIMDAVIGTASAILAATINGLSAPWPISMVMVPLLVGMAAVTGAVQIATIAATPIPSFSSGGIVSGSNDHLYPNIPKSKNGADRTLAWLAEGETVLTRNQTEMYNNIMARDTFNSVNNSNINHITNDIKIYTDNKTNTKLLAKQIVLEISRGYS